MDLREQTNIIQNQVKILNVINKINDTYNQIKKLEEIEQNILLGIRQSCENFIYNLEQLGS